MFTGQILVYQFNDLSNAKEGVDRNRYSIRKVQVETKKEFKSAIEDSLDEFPPGKGYALVRWGGRNFLCEKDVNNPQRDYVRHEISYHPLLTKFSE